MPSSEESTGGSPTDLGSQRPVRAKRLPRPVRERQILDAAVLVFARHGYHEASMDEISDVADISKPMIYAYLGSKEELFTACIQRGANQLLEAIAVDVVPGQSPDAQLWHGLRAFFGFVGENRDTWQVLHRQSIAQGGPFAEELTAIRERAIKLVTELLVRAGTDEGMGATVTIVGEGLAAGLVGAAESMADWWLDHLELSADALAAQLMNLTWLGFGDLIRGRAWSPPARS